MQKRNENEIPCVDCLVLPMCIDKATVTLINTCPRAHQYLIKEVTTSVHKVNKTKSVTITNNVMDMVRTKILDQYFSSIRG